MKKIIFFTFVFIVYHLTFNIYNCSAQWVQMPNGMGTMVNAMDFAISGNNIFVGALIGAQNGGVFLSTNNGDNWVEVNNGLTNLSVHELLLIGNNLFAGSYGGIFLSTNNGGNWTAVNSGLTNLNVWSLEAIGTNLFAGTQSGGVFLSTNNGGNWTAVNNGLTNFFVYELLSIGNNIFAGTNGGGVYLSTNNGTSWIAVNNGLTSLTIRSLFSNGTCLFAGTYDGVFLSTNNGGNWTAVNNGITNSTIYAITGDGTNIFAGTSNYPSGGGVFHSTNNGGNWSKINEGLISIPHIYSLLIANNYIFAGTWLQSVWRRPLSELVGVNYISKLVPSSYSLHQNYPNPFNPSTKINFSLPESGFTTLKVYNMLGKEVATLVNEKLNAGSYGVDFNGSNLSSGIYFYRIAIHSDKIKTEGFSDVKRMILIK